MERGEILLFNFDLRKEVIKKFSQILTEEEKIDAKEAQEKTLKFLAEIDNEVADIKKQLWEITNNWYQGNIDLSKVAITQFNIIEQIEKQYGIIPGGTITDKVKWVKENVIIKH